MSCLNKLSLLPFRVNEFFVQQETLKSNIFIYLRTSLVKIPPSLNQTKQGFQNEKIWLCEALQDGKLLLKTSHIWREFLLFGLDKLKLLHRHHLTPQFPSALLCVVSFDLLLETGICFQSKSSDKPTINYWLSTHAVDKAGDKLLTIVE